ncbi:hypothetical protein [Alteromonas sp. 009811495]|uniref:hypothetical protein n=1 Tax=Alteromonas sp. 009811495 TaxID=3002962 RepID=UPI00237E7574|nr:hypothetical protein [Alteromonas sp. 009811495]WDT85119.1 hypothetical protein OZ660_14400 [Alteromonas sp. 009811495]
MSDGNKVAYITAGGTVVAALVAGYFVYPRNQPPEAIIDPAPDGSKVFTIVQGQTAQLTAIDSGDPEDSDSDLYFQWTSIDGETLFEGLGVKYRVLELSNLHPETHVIILNVTDEKGNGKMDSDKGTLVVTAGQSPEIRILNYPTSVEIPGSATFDASKSIDPQNLKLNFAWFVDGKVVGEHNPSLTYPNFIESKTYTVELVLTNSIGLHSSWKAEVVGKRPPRPVSITTRVLGGPLEIMRPGEVVTFSGEIITNGYPIKVIADRLEVDDARITSFQRISSDEEVTNGSNGRPGSNGTARGENGRSGQNGADGSAGTQGQSAGQIEIEVNEFSGNLEIFNVGTNGAHGGNGGNGGDGGDGARGTPSRSGLIDCSSGPGRGGTGGNGGNGGSGGPGGIGGNGGPISIKVDEKFNGLIEAQTIGGAAGAGGRPGAGGTGGAGGPEGETRGWCKSAARYGGSGQNGESGSVPLPSSSGVPGEISFNVKGQETSTRQGSARYSED